MSAVFTSASANSAPSAYVSPELLEDRCLILPGNLSTHSEEILREKRVFANVTKLSMRIREAFSGTLSVDKNSIEIAEDVQEISLRGGDPSLQENLDMGCVRYKQ